MLGVPPPKIDYPPNDPYFNLNKVCVKKDFTWGSNEADPPRVVEACMCEYYLCNEIPIIPSTGTESPNESTIKLPKLEMNLVLIGIISRIL